MRRNRIVVCLLCLLNLVVVALSGLAITVGPWLWGTDWHVYGDEGTRTTPAEERAAMRCAPRVSTVSVLDINPGEIDIHLRGSAGRARHVASCLRHSAGIVDADAVRSR